MEYINKSHFTANKSGKQHPKVCVSVYLCLCLWVISFISLIAYAYLSPHDDHIGTMCVFVCVSHTQRNDKAINTHHHNDNGNDKVKPQPIFIEQSDNSTTFGNEIKTIVCVSVFCVKCKSNHH